MMRMPIVMLLSTICVVFSLEGTDDFLSSQWDDAIDWRADGVDVSFVKQDGPAGSVPASTQKEKWNPVTNAYAKSQGATQWVILHNDLTYRRPSADGYEYCTFQLRNVDNSSPAQVVMHFNAPKAINADLERSVEMGYPEGFYPAFVWGPHPAVQWHTWNIWAATSMANTALYNHRQDTTPFATLEKDLNALRDELELADHEKVYTAFTFAMDYSGMVSSSVTKAAQAFTTGFAGVVDAQTSAYADTTSAMLPMLGPWAQAQANIYKNTANVQKKWIDGSAKYVDRWVQYIMQSGKMGEGAWFSRYAPGKPKTSTQEADTSPKE